IDKVRQLSLDAQPACGALSVQSVGTPSPLAGELEAELFQLRGVEGAGCVRQWVDARLRLRERDHLADVLLTGEDRDEAIDADRETGVRRRAVAARIQKKTKTFLCILGLDAEQRD